MDRRYLEAGKIVNTHGVHGEVKIIPWADSPEFLTGFKRWFIDGAEINVLSARVHKRFVIAALSGISSIDGAVRLKNKTVCISRDDTHLEAGHFFIADLVGLRAVDEGTGAELGVIADVLTLPANNVYVIKGEREILVPAVPEFVTGTDIEAGFVSLRLIDGM